MLGELFYDTPYVSSDIIDKFIAYIEAASKSLFKWFDENSLKSNADKFHLLSST